jgi:hypothetical protein
MEEKRDETRGGETKGRRRGGGDISVSTITSKSA